MRLITAIVMLMGIASAQEENFIKHEGSCGIKVKRKDMNIPRDKMKKVKAESDFGTTEKGCLQACIKHNNKLRKEPEYDES